MSMAITGSTTTMAILTEWLWKSLTSYENLELAYNKSKKGKSTRKDVIEFTNNLEENLNALQTELMLGSYKPQPLISFVIRDPKTRTIRKSEFRDRIVHHAICNIIEPIFQKSFIYDSFANQKGKGTSKALERFEYFKRKVSKNNTKTCYVLKADIKHYFEEVKHDILINIIRKQIKDERIIDLIRKVLNNHKQGMPLGNMTSQFFANVYLNELDNFVKHNLKISNYIRYVDDFVILNTNKSKLECYKSKIETFLKNKLDLELHQTKSKILTLNQGINFLGFRIFKHHKLLRKSSIRIMKKRLNSQDYNSLHNSAEGWLAYAKQANTYNLRKGILSEINNKFQGQISDLEISRLSRMVKS